VNGVQIGKINVGVFVVLPIDYNRTPFFFKTVTLLSITVLLFG
jgi:hypothetical protein